MLCEVLRPPEGLVAPSAAVPALSRVAAEVPLKLVRTGEATVAALPRAGVRVELLLLLELLLQVLWGHRLLRQLLLRQRRRQGLLWQLL